MASLNSTKVDLSGLLEVLGKNLYSTPSVAIRELIQNSHDACIRHSLETNTKINYRIDIKCFPEKQLLIIKDNGSGLTYSEIENFLATIGSGYTRIIRDKSATEDMIGYFGLGFLSAYVIADKVEVITTSYQDSEKTWKFSSKGGQRFSIDDTENTVRGSEVHLHLKEKYKQLASEHTLSKLLLKYCCLMPIDIFLGNPQVAINNVTPPWLKNTSKLANKKNNLEFSKLFEHQFEPLCTLPILENDLKVEGCLWIQDGGGYASSDFRNVNVFVRNMFITNDEVNLLPRWAGFCGCVINTPSLNPTASREDIQTDENYSLIQELLCNSLVEGLKQIAKNEPENWRRILRKHNENLLGASICDDRLFDQLQDELKLPTSMGKKSPSAISKVSKGKLYIQPEEHTGYQSVLFKSQMLPIISGHYYAVTAFSQKYAQSNNLKTVLIGNKEDEKELFPITEISNDHSIILNNLFKKSDEEIIFSKFEPDYIPLIIVENHEGKLKKRIESDQADKRIGSAILALARKSTSQIEENINRRIYLNMNNNILENITKFDSDKQILISNMIRSYVATLCQDNEELNFVEEIKAFFNNLTILVGNK